MGSRLHSAALGLLLAAAPACTSPEPPPVQRYLDRLHVADTALFVEDSTRAERELLRALPDASAIDRQALLREAGKAPLPRKPQLQARRPNFTPLTLERLAELRRSQDRLAEAESLYRQALTLREERFDTTGRYVTPALFGLARVQAGQDRVGDAFLTHQWAVDNLEAVLAFRKEFALGAASVRTRLREGHAGLAEVLLERGEYAHAESLYAAALELSSAYPASGDYEGAELHRSHARALDGLGRSQDAAAARSRAEEILRGTSYAHLALNKDTVVARWTATQMPLRIHVPIPPAEWVRDPETTRDLVRDAFLEWTGLDREGMLRFTFTEAAEDAHVAVTWRRASGGAQVGRCEGPVTWDAQPLSRQEITLVVRLLDREVPRDALRRAAIHEMGHALGIQGHSPARGDIMFEQYNEAMDTVTARDRLTLEKLYAEEPGEYPRW